MEQFMPAYELCMEEAKAVDAGLARARAAAREWAREHAGSSSHPADVTEYICKQAKVDPYMALMTVYELISDSLASIDNEFRMQFTSPEVKS
jgi:hypothetical protein